MVVIINQNTEKVKLNKTFFAIALERQMLLDSLKNCYVFLEESWKSCSLVGRPDHLPGERLESQCPQEGGRGFRVRHTSSFPWNTGSQSLRHRVDALH